MKDEKKVLKNEECLNDKELNLNDLDEVSGGVAKIYMPTVGISPKTAKLMSMEE